MPSRRFRASELWLDIQADAYFRPMAQKAALIGSE